MSTTFSCQEPAPRTVVAYLSNVEMAAVILFHERQRKRIARLAGELATGENPEYTPKQIGEALELCQDQRAAHQARALELSAQLRRSHAQKGSPHN